MAPLRPDVLRKRIMKILLLVLSIWIVLPVAISFARYSPPAYSWRGIFATHPWIIVKRAGEASYTRYEVMGWGGGTSLKINHSPADALWYGAAPRLLLDRRGPEAEPLIGKVESAIESYPFKD